MTAPIAGDPDLERLRSLVENARRAVVFTGAGISTESGNPRLPQPGRHVVAPPSGRLSRLRRVGVGAAPGVEPAGREPTHDGARRAQPRPSRRRVAGPPRHRHHRDHAEHRRAAPEIRRAGRSGRRTPREHDVREVHRVRGPRTRSSPSSMRSSATARFRCAIGAAAT